MIYVVIIMYKQRIYRKNQAGDVDAVYRLICQLEQATLPYEAFRSIYLQQLESAHDYSIICEQDQQVVGFLHLRLEDQLHHAGKIAEIMELVVDDDVRRQGIGKELLNRADIAAQKHGCMQIEASSHERRRDAHRFYEQNGFQSHHKKFTKKVIKL